MCQLCVLRFVITDRIRIIGTFAHWLIGTLFSHSSNTTLPFPTFSLYPTPILRA